MLNQLPWVPGRKIPPAAKEEFMSEAIHGSDLLSLSFSVKNPAWPQIKGAGCHAGHIWLRL